MLIYLSLISLTIFELFRFGFKFTPFTNKEYLFPATQSIEFLQKQKGQFRIMFLDSRIFPPNFSVVYKLQSVEGYDPLYLKRYGELIAASERGNPNISLPFGFNRIITPHNYNSKIIDLLGVKYILSLSKIDSQKLEEVFQEGETRVYENKNAMPRAFFVKNLEIVKDSKKAIEKLFQENFDLKNSVVIEQADLTDLTKNKQWFLGNAQIVEYSENKIVIRVENKKEGFLILTDSFYPTWRAKIDNLQVKIYKVNYNFRGVAVPEGRHIIIFYNSLF